MKTILTAVFLLTAACAQADVIVSQSFSPDLTIPEGNPVGVETFGTFTAAPAGNKVGNVTVGLTISGGYNGDLYAWLTSPNGTLVTLMSQPGTGVNGFGAESSGMEITLAETGALIQNVTGGAGTVLTGAYQTADPMGTFNDSAANGTWSLYFADMGSGGGSPVLDTWSLEIDAVPEPVNGALILFFVVWGMFTVCRWHARRGLKLPAVAAAKD